MFLRLNAGMIHESNPKHLIVFKVPCGDDPEQNAWTIYASNGEHLLGGAGGPLVQSARVQVPIEDFH